MKRSLIIGASVLALGATGMLSMVAVSPLAAQSAGTQVAALQTMSFTIENMTCALCPVTVKTAMERVSGVRSVRVDFDATTATVVFDPSVATPAAIAAASANAGYPAAIQQGS